MPTIKCQNCNLEFKIKPYQLHTAKFCSKICGDTFKRVLKTCVECGSTYSVKRIHAETNKYCSMICKSNFRRKNLVGKNGSNYKNGNWGKVEVSCRECGKNFLQFQGYLRKGFGDICSKECRSIITSRNQKLNPSHQKEQIRCVCESCGAEKYLPPCFAKGFRFCSKLCRAKWQKSRMSGTNHPNWQGGISPRRNKVSVSSEYKQWRIQVFKRDLFTCQKCGDSKGGNLHAHHIKPFALFPELETVVENGLTLCENCHILIHQETPSVQSLLRAKQRKGLKLLPK